MPDSIVPIISTAGRSGAFRHMKQKAVKAMRVSSNLASSATKHPKGSDRGPTKRKK